MVSTRGIQTGSAGSDFLGRVSSFRGGWCALPVRQALGLGAVGDAANMCNILPQQGWEDITQLGFEPQFDDVVISPSQAEGSGHVWLIAERDNQKVAISNYEGELTVHALTDLPDDCHIYRRPTRQAPAQRPAARVPAFQPPSTGPGRLLPAEPRRPPVPTRQEPVTTVGVTPTTEAAGTRTRARPETKYFVRSAIAGYAGPLTTSKATASLHRGQEVKPTGKKKGARVEVFVPSLGKKVWVHGGLIQVQ